MTRNSAVVLATTMAGERVISPSLLENLDLDKPVPAQFNIGMDEWIQYEATDANAVEQDEPSPQESASQSSSSNQPRPQVRKSNERSPAEEPRPKKPKLTKEKTTRYEYVPQNT